MATYTMLSNGSSGSEVKKLQTALVNAGYSVGSSGVDGIYGSNTEAAVRAYQKANGLSVDGIAGDQTLGKLYGSGTSTNASSSSTSSASTTTPTQAADSTPDYSKYAYDSASDAAYQQALSALQAAQKTVPTYAGTYDQQLQDIYDKIMNREKFSYNVNEDALYQQYADQYTQKGKLAMMDTMGQAAALTGGYGNSYAQSVGQQAYQGYLQQLNDVVPELYGMALDQYNQEGDALLNQYAMVGDMADNEYSKYMDALDQYWQNVSFLQDQANNAYDQGYNNWYNSYQNAYQAQRDKIEDEQWQKSYEYQLARDKVADEQWQKEYDLAAGTASGGSSGGSSSGSSGGSSGSSGSSSGSSGGGGYNNGSLTTAQVKALQQALGVTADGLYGANSKSAAGGLSADEAYKKYVGSSGGTVGSTSVTPTSTTATKNIIAQVMTRSEYYRYTNSYAPAGQDTSDRYEDYLRRIVENKSRGLSDGEIAYLYNYYNLW